VPPTPPALPTDAEMGAVLREAELFRGLDPSAVDQLLPSFAPRALARNQDVFSVGEPGDTLYVVVRGRVLLKRVADDQQAVLAVLGPADMCGELSVFDPGPRTSSASAAVASVVAALHRDALLDWAAGDREITERLLRVLARRLRRTNDSMTDLLFIDVPGRLAKVLLDLASRFGTRRPGAVVVEHGLTQADLAHLVGASRETVNKALSDFADRGWLRSDIRSTLLLDVDRLAARARVNAPSLGRPARV
jgi:CRP/FNR family cyclic AMP-dependent transcriptional regulator